MAGEGGSRPWWPSYLGVNLANGNLHLELGPGSCVTCGGSGGGSPYVDPQASHLSGPTLILPFFEWLECHLSCLDWCASGGRPGTRGWERR